MYKDIPGIMRYIKKTSAIIYAYNKTTKLDATITAVKLAEIKFETNLVEMLCVLDLLTEIQED